MLSQYSFSDFAVAAAVILLIYYGYVILRFYPELLSRFTARMASGTDVSVIRMAPDGTTEDPDDVPKAAARLQDDDLDDEFNQVESFIAQIKAAVADCAGVDADQLKQKLQMVIAANRQMKYSALRYSFNEFISSEVEKVLSVALSEEELEQMWEM